MEMVDERIEICLVDLEDMLRTLGATEKEVEDALRYQHHVLSEWRPGAIAQLRVALSRALQQRDAWEVVPLRGIH